MALHILSGGAAKGLVSALQKSFGEETGVAIEGAFGAVGVMKDRFLAGEACDVIILTAALIEQLTKDGHVVPGSSAALGRVLTGIAVRSDEAMPDVSSRESLAKALLVAKGIYFPDPERATAGIHFANVLRQLGIYDEVASRLRPYPNGATAMAAMAATSESDLIGCTQVTEIKYTEGVTLVAPLPKEFELATIYTAAVASKSVDPMDARQLVALLSGSTSAKVRADGGFEF
jgi:molybdate transport system substrate-binding protein